MYIVYSIAFLLLFNVISGHDGHEEHMEELVKTIDGETGTTETPEKFAEELQGLVEIQAQKEPEQKVESPKDLPQEVLKSYGQVPSMPQMSQMPQMPMGAMPQMPGQKTMPNTMQVLQMLLKPDQIMPFMAAMMGGEPEKIDPNEGYNTKCDEDPMLRNGDDCGDYALRKPLKGQYTSQAWKCNTFECYCPYFGGNFVSEGDGRGTCFLPNGQPLRKAVRREYRTLSDEERHRYHEAVKKLMEDGIFDEISALHLNITSQHKAHYMDKTNSNIKFWNWHQHYIKRFEFELRKIDPELAIPYWDSTLDENLPASRDSIMWTDDFMGRTDENGTVFTGPGAHWMTLNGKLLKRRPVFWGPLFKEADLKFWLGESQLDMPRHPVRMFTCKRQLHELFNMHGNVHHYLGQDLPTATNDPVFYLLHSWMELLFKLWTQQKDRNCHVMGLIDDEIDETVEYIKRPTCTRENPDCGSKYLFCDQTKPEPICAVKIRIGGICEGLDNRDQPCHNGICQHNKCVEAPQQAPPQPEAFQAPQFKQAPHELQQLQFQQNPQFQAPQGQGPQQQHSTMMDLPVGAPHELQQQQFQQNPQFQAPQGTGPQPRQEPQGLQGQGQQQQQRHMMADLPMEEPEPRFRMAMMNWPGRFLPENGGRQNMAFFQ